MEKIAELIRFVFLTGGVIYLITRSAIFMVPRMWLASKNVGTRVLLYCAACTGFWVGAAAYQLWPWSMNPVEAAVAGCFLGSLLSVIWGGGAVEVELEALDGATQKEEHGTS